MARIPFLKKKFIGKGKNGLTWLESEIQILNNLNHTNIARLYEVLETHDKLYLIVEYCSQTLTADIPMGEEQARVMFKQLMKILQYLHENVEISHRDIKPDNIMIGQDGMVKLVDFGSA